MTIFVSLLCPLPLSEQKVLRNCCNQLTRKMSMQTRMQKSEARKKELLTYVPKVCASVYAVLKRASDRCVEEAVAQSSRLDGFCPPFSLLSCSTQPGGSPQKRSKAMDDVRSQIRQGTVTLPNLVSRLRHYVELSADEDGAAQAAMGGALVGRSGEVAALGGLR